MSARSVLSHELSHQKFRFTKARRSSWNDEFRASYWAANNVKNLSDFERATLINDALLRATEANKVINIGNNIHIRRILYGH